VARDFDGVDDKIAWGSPAALTLNRDFTIAAWINNDGGGINQSILSHGDGEWYFRLTTTDQLQFLESQVAGLLTGTTALGTGTWRHAAVTISSAATATLIIYLDGVSDGTTTTTATLDNGTQQVTIGAESTGGVPALDEFFNGKIAEVAVWNVALTAAEVAVLADSFSPAFVRPSNLVFYPPLIGRNSPETDLKGIASGTFTGTAAADHPRIIYPAAPVMVYRAAAGVAAVTPTGHGRLLSGIRNAVIQHV